MRRTVLFFSLLAHQLFVEAEWSYSGETGPAYWSKFYPACAEARQSPIEIHHDSAETDEELTPFQFEGYNHTRNHENMTVWNDGYTVTIRVHGSVKIRGGGLSGKYSLKHFHFHWGSNDEEGSEHMLDGKSYPLELHFVHQTQKYHAISDALQDPSGLAVLGVFAKIGKHHPYFERIIENTPLLDIGDWATVLPFPIEKLLPEDTETFYRYEGSLTTPPCSESVIWTLFREPIEISEEQMEQLRYVSAMANVTSNYRPVQRLNGRRLYVRRTTGSGASNVLISTISLMTVFIVGISLSS